MTQEIKLPSIVQKFMEEVVWKVNPDFQIRNKANPDGLYKIASKVVGLFNKKMETNYITVINGQCWFPASYFSADGTEFLDQSSRVIEILAHETIHEYDRKRLGTPLFTLMYLFPQAMAVLSCLAVFAVWNSWWLLSFLFLLCLAPLPAPGRAWIEVRGYKTNVSLGSLNGWDPALLSRGIIENNFTSANYYYMMPFFDWASKRLLDRSHESEDIYKTIIDWYKKNVMVTP